MAWIDSMRLRRKADIVRAVGWVNLFVCIVWSLVHVSDGLAMLAVTGAWAAAVMALAYGIAYVIDRRADRVVGR